jgi:hypothetical protein
VNLLAAFLTDSRGDSDGVVGSFAQSGGGSHE